MAFRAFISADLPELQSVRALAEELRRTGAALKIVDVSRVHLTLKFLGETEEALVPRIVARARAGDTLPLRAFSNACSRSWKAGVHA